MAEVRAAADRIVIGVDPGLTGAIAGLRVRAGRVVGVAVMHACEYYPRASRSGAGRIEVQAVGAALREVQWRLMDGHKEAPDRGPMLIEALGVRPGESAQATVTAATAWGALRAAVAAEWGIDRVREIQPQAVDVLLGWAPAGAKTLRKLRNLAQAVAVCEAAGQTPGAVLTPPRGRGMSDGAADAVCIALAGAGTRANAPEGAGEG